MPTPLTAEIEQWPIERLVEYPRNPRKNDAAVDRMCGVDPRVRFQNPGVWPAATAKSSTATFGSRPRASSGITEIPVILCDEWTPAQVKAFRLMVNRSVTWADWDEELLALELQELQAADFDLSLTGFDPGEIDDLLALDDEEKANAAPPLPGIAGVPARRSVAAADRTGCSAAMRPARKLSRGCSASASRG